MDDLLKKLEGGDRRSIGRVNEVVAGVFADPSLFGVLFEGMLSQDPIVRMRSADAAEKITAERPDYLRPYKSTLINQVAKSEQQEVRWHAAQMFSRLDLTPEERFAVMGILMNYLKDKSNIVRVFFMQGLADIARADNALKPKILRVIREMTETGSPAVINRGRRLLAGLD
jgi:hypothetical protein